jgi:hypothetical protein
MALLAKFRNLPFDKLRVNGLRLRLFSFSVRGELVEPQKNTFSRSSLCSLLRPHRIYGKMSKINPGIQFLGTKHAKSNLLRKEHR